MTDILKPLGQSAPSATTEADLYTVPDLTQTTTSSLVICNRGAVSATFRVSVAPDGETTEDKHYLFYDASISGNETISVVIGMTLNQTDVVRVYASTGNLSFNLFGVETS